MIFVMWVRHRVEQILGAVEAPSKDLHLIAQLLERVEAEGLTAPRLVLLKKELETEGLPASRQIARLRRLVELHDWEHNLFFRPIAFLLLWGPNVAFAIEQWRLTSGGHVARWIQAIGEIEALSSLAAHASEHPEDPFPELDGGCSFEGVGISHPLLPESAGVRNDVRLGGELRLLLVSGSNMSGKSTLLRSTGLNVVLAWAGAPVRARSLRVSPLQVGAAMRAQDSVLDGKSRFYAEITRIRQIVDLTSERTPLLFLLDELLSGTNSHDRRIGSEAIVRSLVERGAIGLVTTHDLALADIAEQLAPRAANVHFEDHIQDGHIAFDYRLRQGVVRKSNAIELMRSVGLDV
jgi:DNA mismatch repair ATPase MutS